MKTELERVDFGGHPKYNAGIGSALFPGRSVRFGAPKSTKICSLFDLNPHRNALGLNLQEYTADKLCPRPSLAELHSDATQPAAADEAGALVGSEPQAAAVADEAHADKAAADDAEAAGRPKRQRVSEQPAPTAAAAGGAKPPSLDTLVSVSVGGDSSPSRGDEFVIIDTSSSSSSDAGDSSSESGGEGEDGGGHSSPHTHTNKQQQKQPEAGQQQQQRGKHQAATPAAAAAAAAAGDGDADDGGDSVCSSDMSVSDEGEDQDEDYHTMTMSGDEGSDDEFIPLLDIAPGQGNDGSSDPAATLQQQQQQRAAGYQPPWLPRLAHFSSPLLRLHNEIVAFCQMLAPTAEEVASRAASLEALREVVRGIWPTAGVQVFGSYETGLYTPASDTDVVVVGSGVANAQKGLKALAQALEGRHLVRNMQQVLTARVPIIKFEMIDSGLAFDVSWEVPSGPKGAEVVKQLLQDWPALKPLALVLKVFLTQRELNEVYTGGVGSYTLIIMIVAFLQLHQSRRPAQHDQQDGHKRRRSGNHGSSNAAQLLDCNLGVLLVDFMRLYGRVLNLNRVGITSNSHGRFFDRTSKGFAHVNRKKGAFTPPGQVSLCVEDPIDATNDTARGSYNMRLVRQVFDHAYQLLNVPCPAHMSTLGRIIHLAPVISGRPVPPWCVEAPSRTPGRSSRHHHNTNNSRHRSSSRQQQQRHSRRRSSSGERHKHRHHSRGSDRDRERERERDRGRRDSRQTHGSSRSRSKSSSRHYGKQSSGGGGGSSRQHESGKKQQQRHSSGSKQSRRSSEGSKGGNSSRGQQQKIDKWVERSPGNSNKGQQRGNQGSRQSFGGSDSGREYAHKDKRRRY